MTQTILEAAQDIIYGDRAEAYGPYDKEANKLALLFTIVLGYPVPTEKVPLLMVALKLCRLSQNPTHTDSWLDIAGYVGCAGKLPSIWGTDAPPTGEPTDDIPTVDSVANVFDLRPTNT